MRCRGRGPGSRTAARRSRPRPHPGSARAARAARCSPRRMRPPRPRRGLLSPAVRVDVVDPSAYTPPYDHALAAALAEAGADVRLVTSRFAYGAVPRSARYAVDERFYRGVPAGGPLRVPAKLARHVPDMLRTARAARGAGVVHFQWLAVQPLDTLLLRTFPHPIVLTAHDVLPREPRPGQRAAQRRLYAVVVHSDHG